MDTIEITEATRDAWHIVSVRGRVDGLTADRLEQALKAAVGAHPQVAVDCAAIDYISSAGLRSLLEGARAAQAAKRTFVLCAPSARARQVFDISRLQQVLTIREDLPC